MAENQSWYLLLWISVFFLNTGKYGQEKTPYLDTFHAVYLMYKYKSANKIPLNSMWCPRETSSHWKTALMHYIVTVWKMPDSNFLLVPIFLFLEWIQKNTDLKKPRTWTFLTQWIFHQIRSQSLWNLANSHC